MGKHNEALVPEIEILRSERDQAVSETEFLRAECFKLSSMMGQQYTLQQRDETLVQKCHCLELELENACAAGEVAQQEFSNVVCEKDNVIFEREQVIKMLEEHISMLQEESTSMQKNWSAEKSELQNLIDETEREHARHQNSCQILKAEVDDLHAMLTAMEQTTKDAELRHASGIEHLKKENAALQNDLLRLRQECKAVNETNLRSQKEAMEVHAEAAGLRAQLQSALHDAYAYQRDLESCRSAYEQLNQSFAIAEEHIIKLTRMRKDDENHHLQQLNEFKISWQAEKDRQVAEGLLRAHERMDKLLSQNSLLKKKLTQSYKVLALITTDYNKLKVQFSKHKGKSCNMLKGTKSASTMLPSDVACEDLTMKNVPIVDSKSFLEERSSIAEKEARLGQEMAELADRQMNLLEMLTSTRI